MNGKFRDQNVNAPLALASLMAGLQTVSGLNNAKAQIAKQIASEFTKPRTVDILRQQDCRQP